MGPKCMYYYCRESAGENYIENIFKSSIQSRAFYFCLERVREMDRLNWLSLGFGSLGFIWSVMVGNLGLAVSVSYQ